MDFSQLLIEQDKTKIVEQLLHFDIKHFDKLQQRTRKISVLVFDKSCKTKPVVRQILRSFFYSCNLAVARQKIPNL